MIDVAGQLVPTLGDPLPDVLRSFWEHVATGRRADAAACFGPHGVHAGVPAADETAPRLVAVGPAAIEQGLADTPFGGRHVPRLCVSNGRDTLVEAEIHDGGVARATMVCSVRVGTNGLIDRFLAYACRGARQVIPTDVPLDRTPADAAAVVHDYFAHLDAGDFTAAAADFSTDVLYSHPPYRHTGIDDPDRIEFRGREALAAAFRTRGKASFDHDVVALIQRGPHCMFEGVVDNLPGGGSGSFVSSLSLAADGTIRRYVSFYCEPGVPRH
jgi:hypothetical protein